MATVCSPVWGTFAWVGVVVGVDVQKLRSPQLCFWYSYDPLCDDLGLDTRTKHHVLCTDGMTTPVRSYFHRDVFDHDTQLGRLRVDIIAVAATNR